MASCTRCGNKLPTFSFGDAGDLCKDCKAARASFGIPEAAPKASIAVNGPWYSLTTIIVGINLVVFAAMTLSGVSPLEPTSAQLLHWGANWGPYSLGAQPWRMLASNYVHIGIIHIALNMWCLWNIGRMAERIFDRWTYFLLYTICGLAGSIASLLHNPMGVGAGASGAIFGIAGVLIAVLALGKLPFSKQRVQATLKSLVTFAGYNLFFGAVDPRIDNAAHIGGLLAGLITGAIFAKGLSASPESRQAWRFAVFAASFLILAGGFVFVRKADAYVVSLGLGMDAWDRRDIDAAIRNLEAASASKPRDPIVLSLLGSAYLEKADYEKAANTLQRLVETGRSDPDTLYNLGLAQLKLGRSQEAIASMEAVLKLEPNNADAEQILGEAYLAIGNQSAAKAAFDKAEALRKTAPSR